MRWLMFGPLVILAVLMAAFTSIIPVYAMLLHGQALSAPTAVIAAGLDQGWLYLFAVTGIGCFLKTSLPMFTYGFRPGGIVSTGVCLFIWLLALAGSSGAILMAAGHLLPDQMSNQTMIALLASWPVLDIVSALLPIVLMGPREPADGPRNAPVSTDQRRETRPEPPRLDGLDREVVVFLNSVANGRQVDGAQLSTAGDILTTQRALGEALALSAASVNRILRSLAAAGCIRLTTSPKGTRIRLL